MAQQQLPLAWVRVWAEPPALPLVRAWESADAVPAILVVLAEQARAELRVD